MTIATAEHQRVRMWLYRNKPEILGDDDDELRGLNVRLSFTTTRSKQKAVEIVNCFVRYSHPYPFREDPSCHNDLNQENVALCICCAFDIHATLCLLVCQQLARYSSRCWLFG